MFTVLLGVLVLLSGGLLLWQCLVAWKFPLHERDGFTSETAVEVTVFKPLKGCDAETKSCLRSWMAQEYPGPVQILFGVANGDDPVCEIVRQLLKDFPLCDAQLVICPQALGANAKVSTLIQLMTSARHSILCISDADVFAPPNLLSSVVRPLRNPDVGLVNCFYEFSGSQTLAMHCEAIAVNADFWSQVLQARSLRPMDFALGAVMATPRRCLEAVGGFSALANCLADDYQLGHRIAATGARIELCPVVVQCRERVAGWREVWTHQLRWARTIRICQPLPYFFSLLNNVTLWTVVYWAAAMPLVWGIDVRTTGVWGVLSSIGLANSEQVVVTNFDVGRMMSLLVLLFRVFAALLLQRWLTRSWGHLGWFWLAPIRDLFGFAIWVSAFLGRNVSWRGQTYSVDRAGQLK